MGWIGVDLDGSLAMNGGEWKGITHIGEPIPKMVERVKKWIEEGKDVRIFTARVAYSKFAQQYIEKWCQEHIGKILPVTATKDLELEEYWDDRAVQLIPNTGERADGKDRQPEPKSEPESTDEAASIS